MSEQNEPTAWIRKWAFDGMPPVKVKNAKGRWELPLRFKLLPVTICKCLPDDVPIFARQDERKTDEQIRDAALEEAAKECGRMEMIPGRQQARFVHHSIPAAAKAILALMGKEGKS